MKYKIIRSHSDFFFELEQRKLTLHEVDLRDIRTRVYISKVERRKDYNLVVLEQPDYDKIKGHFSVKEVYFIITDTILIIYDPQASRYVDQFFTEARIEEAEKTSSTLLFLQMLDFFSRQMYRSIPNFNREVMELQEAVLDQSDNRDLINNVQRVKGNLVTYYGILEPILDLNSALLEIPEYSKTIAAREILQDYSEKITKIIKSITNFQKQMQVLTESNEAQSARRTNRNIGILTTMNAMLLLPQIVLEVWNFVVYKSATPPDYMWLLVALFVSCSLIILYLKRLRII